MGTIASLNISLGADSAKLKRDLDKSERDTKRFGKRSAKNVNQLSKSFKGLGVAIAGIATAAAGGFGAAIKSTASYAREIQNTANFARLGTTEMQKFAFATRQYGVSGEKAADQVKDLREKIGEFVQTGSGGFKDLYEAAQANGVDIDLAKLANLNGVDQIKEVANILDQLNVSSDTKSFLLESLGSDLTALMPLLDNGGKLLNEYMANAEGLGQVLSESAVTGLADLSVGFETAGIAIKNSFGEALAANKDEISAMIDGISSAISAVAVFSADNPKIVSAVAGIGAVTVGLGALALAVSAISLPVLAVGAAIAGLVAIWSNWDTIIKSSDAYLSDKFGFTLTEIGQKIANIASWLRENLIPAFNILKDAVSTTIDNMVLLLGAVKDVFTLDFASAGQKMQTAFGNVVDFWVRNFGDSINNIVGNIKAQFTWAFESVASSFTNFFKTAINAVLKPIESFVNDMISKVNAIKPFGAAIAPVSLGGYELNQMPENPGWQNFNQSLGNTAPVLTDPAAITTTTLPPAVAPTNTPETTPPITPPITPQFTGGGSGGSKADAKQEVTDSFLESIKGTLSQALKSGDWKEFASSIFDQITGTIVDNFANGLVDGLAEGLGFGAKDGKGFFDGMFEKFGSDVKNGVSGALEGSNFQDIFKNFGSGLKDMFGGLFEGIGGGKGGGLFSGLAGLFGGGSGGSGGGFGSLIGGFGSILGFSDGGIVPHKPGFSKLGVDSVPAMLQPGEVVIPTNEIDNVLNSRSNGGATTVNFNVTGDISRQTEKRIFEMAPQITQIVNNQNKENGYQ